MKHIVIPCGDWQPLTFYLAMEEVVARHFEEECFFTWIVKPTVIFGHNQVMENEVNVAFCREHGINMVRRKSGGGCVYADEGNLMMSYVTPLGSENVEDVFARYLHKVTGALAQLGLDALTTGNNDILLGGRKISGSALYITPDKRHAIAHGTFLHNTDIERMMAAITPSTEKLAKNGVESVRQRVVNLCELSDIDMATLRRRIVDALCDSECVATDMMVAEARDLQW